MIIQVGVMVDYWDNNRGQWREERPEKRRGGIAEGWKPNDRQHGGLRILARRLRDGGSRSGASTEDVINENIDNQQSILGEFGLFDMSKCINVQSASRARLCFVSAFSFLSECLW